MTAAKCYSIYIFFGSLSFFVRVSGDFSGKRRCNIFNDLYFKKKPNAPVLPPGIPKFVF